MSNIVDLKQITKLNAINKHTYTAPLALFLDQKNQKKKKKKNGIYKYHKIYLWEGKMIPKGKRKMTEFIYQSCMAIYS